MKSTGDKTRMAGSFRKAGEILHQNGNGGELNYGGGICVATTRNGLENTCRVLLGRNAPVSIGMMIF